ncbi:MAG: O-antigen ligase family protein [Patescibacteria group bacterium]
MSSLSRRQLLYWWAGLLVASLLSLLSYYVPALAQPLFWLTVVAFLITAWHSIGLATLLAISELVIGAHGYLFSTMLFGNRVSIRLAFFVMLFLLSSYRVVLSFSDFKQSVKWLKPFFPFAVVTVLAIGLGIYHQHNPGDIFLDGNGYLAFGLLLPFSILYRQVNFKENLLRIVLLASSYVAIQTVLFLYVFSHPAFTYFAFDLYTWLRQNILAEVTATVTGAYRIFTPSQLFLLLGWSIAIWQLALEEKRGKKGGMWFALAALYAGSLLISFSRSFWLGWLISFCFAALYALTRTARTFVTLLVYSFASVVVGFAFVFAVVRFPFPGAAGSFLSFGDRFNLSSEAAASSRWNQLVPLREAIEERPLLGSGFGRSITYLSNDPRVRAIEPSGEYTTVALEWGYLDMLLEFGLVGLLAFLMAVWGCIRLQNNGAVAVGVFFGAVAALGTHIGSPYFNHPIGITLLLIVYVLREDWQSRAVAVDKSIGSNNSTAVDL